MAISVLSVGLYRVKEKLQALLNVDRQFCEDDFEKVPCLHFLVNMYLAREVLLLELAVLCVAPSAFERVALLFQ